MNEAPAYGPAFWYLILACNADNVTFLATGSESATKRISRWKTDSWRYHLRRGRLKKFYGAKRKG
jgi:hypothetical protein